MSIINWLFRRQKIPKVCLGDVQMHLDWNIVSSFCELVGTTAGRQPSQEELKQYFSAALGLAAYVPNDQEMSGGHLFHFAITDLRHGYFGPFGESDYWVPIVIRPSITVKGFLIDIDTGRIMATRTHTQKTPWKRYKNPVFLAWSFFLGTTDPDAAQPMGDMAAIKILKKLKALAKKQTRVDYLLEKNRVT